MEGLVCFLASVPPPHLPIWPKMQQTYASYWQEQITVRGTVKDISSGQPLAGVTVTVKGTNQATTTDDQGNYELEGVPGSATLVFSSIGMESREVAVSNQTTVNMELTATSDNIDEVVVVGYGTQKKATVTGAVSAVKGDELKKSPAVNLSNTIAGRIAGVTAVNRSGEPGEDGSGIRIRGSNTLGDSSPLIVIDGVPARAGGFERLNPADIENISVLKDASAAIYGARAANGVVLVTTKRGKTGKPTLSYTFNQGFSQPTVIPKLADASQYAELRNELEIYKLPVEEWQAATDAFLNTGSYTKPNGDILSAPFTQEDIQKFADGSDPWGHPNTDWYKETLKNWSPQAKHNLQLDGGSEDFRYLMSLGYLNQDGYYKNSANGYKQYDIRLNLDANVNKYVKLQFGMMGRQEDRSFPTKSAGTIFRMTMRGNPTMPAYWPNGMPGPDIENGENPVVISTDASGYDRNKRYYFQTNGQIDIQIPGVEGLKVTGTAAVDKYIRNNKKMGNTLVPVFMAKQ
ncbi:SusC/RagA family TonB-linked outer membrane protein [Sphingobacterium daejeonense]|uniref:SusC/RagA family TonB-linked outer membrane protein n=1 Tax=Sphingobacterium daejeonense TaxID=371142 RepID=UPI0018D7B65B|nr:SusC/RagA family TonB-linked outer membrane protein [Sphingobacterium daejeonense]